MASERASIVDEWLEDDKLMLIEAWARDGYTESDIADNIGINPSTLNYWKKKYEPIREALKSGKEIVDYKVENALLKAALGFTTKEIKVTIGKQVKNGKTVEICKETTIREIAPNVTACAMWLNNRRPDRWKRNRDKIELEEEDNSIQITVVRGPGNDRTDENTNQSITIGKRAESSSKAPEEVQKKQAIKEVDDKDYWPDDWEDEDE